MGHAAASLLLSLGVILCPSPPNRTPAPLVAAAAASADWEECRAAMVEALAHADDWELAKLGLWSAWPCCFLPTAC